MANTANANGPQFRYGPQWPIVRSYLAAEGEARSDPPMLTLVVPIRKTSGVAVSG